MTRNEITDKEIVFKEKRIRLSVRLKYVIFPLDGFKLIESLKNAGYTLLMTPPRRPLTRGASLGFSGPLARKGDLIIDGNTDRGFLGIEGPSFESAIHGFNELNEVIISNFGIDLNEEARFYEIIAQFTLETRKNAIEAIAEVFSESDFIESANSILGERVSIFSIRLRPLNKIPNQEEWFDITIEPDLIKPTDTYKIFVVYRSPNRQKVQKFGEKLESIILKLISVMEKRRK